MSEQNTDASHTPKCLIDQFKSLIDQFSHQFTLRCQQTIAIVSVTDQRLYLILNHAVLKTYPVSTAEAGIGSIEGSLQTPLGIHAIAEKIGEGSALGSIFKARRNTHVIADTIQDANIRSPQDNITSRILWLEGLEEGINKGLDKHQNNVDSYARYIYIHGTDEEGLLGKPASHGCIRLANRDVIELFDYMQKGDLVAITDI